MLKLSGRQHDEGVIQFVDHLINEAVQNNVSDIHIEPYEYHCRIRLRRHGLLHEANVISPAFAKQVVLRLKMMAQLNIAEKRLPLDGRIHSYKTSKINIRISTCPTYYGEKIVLRILHSKAKKLHLDSLGMTTEQKNTFIEKLSSPQGLILVTGPTGSGKTVTLYAALDYLNSHEKNICTVEDPVEIELPGINQVNVHPQIGFNFAMSLRALLRQDPDIIMIGEIRDKETAMIALQAAQTGHLVLSTLHTNHANESLDRLRSLGATINELRHPISLIIGQRLVRMTCQTCQFSHEGMKEISCSDCHLGYKGRTGIFELLTSDDPGEPAVNMWEIGLMKVQTGQTTHAELIRVLGK